MSDSLEQIRAAVDAVALHPPVGFSWFGAADPPVPPAIKRSLAPAHLRAHLLHRLTRRLYIDFYCRGSALPSTGRDPGPGAPTADLMGRFSRANAGRGRWQAGWRLRTIRSDEVTGERKGLTVRAWRQEWRFARGSPRTPGGLLALRLPKDLPASAPGFYLALGDAEPPRRGLLRLYWDLGSSGALRFVRRATTVLNRAGIAFELKALLTADEDPRTDSVVLYARMSDYPALIELLSPVYAAVAGDLRPQVPALTKRLAPGVALAEDPGRGESFGTHRCRLLAQGLVRAHMEGARAAEDRLRSVVEHLASEGINPERPFLSRGSVDAYPAPPWEASRRRYRMRGERVLGTNGSGFLETAAAAGRQVCAAALWHAGHCNWLGATEPHPGDRRSHASARLEALGHDFYGGTSGIGLFLAELYAATGDEAARRTAVGALRQGVAGAGSLATPKRWGLYAGRLGVAIAAARAARLLAREDLARSARGIVEHLLREPLENREVDLISGRAGAICGLLILADLLEEPAWSATAERLGDDLLGLADRGGAGWSWRAPGLSCVRNPTGLSHGAAGIGLALLELHSATGAARYREGMEEAFAYERRWLDSARADWPDFRRCSPRDARVRGRPFPTRWCHGAPGIALSRLRAYEILEDEELRHEAEMALETTRAAAERDAVVGACDLGLCHGLAGLCDVLLEGERLPGPIGRRCRDAAERTALQRLLAAAENGSSRHGLAGSLETPSLMVGTAGVGLFLLRLHDRGVPSVLVWRREDCLSTPSGRATGAHRRKAYR